MGNKNCINKNKLKRFLLDILEGIALSIHWIAIFWVWWYFHDKI
jgi:hypothetical protein